MRVNHAPNLGQRLDDLPEVSKKSAHRWFSEGRFGMFVMSWQWPAIYSGPHKDPDGWEVMVRETHEQMRELMTHYGHIDLVWYDGCVVPGVSDTGMIARYWRSRELNAMVRISLGGTRSNSVGKPMARSWWF